MADGGNFRQIVVVAPRGGIGFVGGAPEKTRLTIWSNAEVFLQLQIHMIELSAGRQSWPIAISLVTIVLVSSS